MASLIARTLLLLTPFPAGKPASPVREPTEPSGCPAWARTCATARHRAARLSRAVDLRETLAARNTGIRTCCRIVLEGETMSYARRMLDTYPRTLDLDRGLLAATIDAVSDCAQACTADTDADLSEQNLAEMVTCIRLCLDCTDVCNATSGVLSRLAQYDPDATRPLLRPASPSARAAATNASGMPRTTSTAGSAPRPAAAANAPARTCWTPSDTSGTALADRRRGDDPRRGSDPLRLRLRVAALGRTDDQAAETS